MTFLVISLNPKALEMAASFLPALFLLPSPGAPSDNLFPANGVAWSLFFEILINLIYAATWRHWTINALIGTCAVAFIALLICRVQLLSFDIGWHWNNALGGLARVCFGFPMGVLLFRLWTQGRLAFRAPLWLIFLGAILVLTPIQHLGLTGAHRFLGYGLEIVWIGMAVPAIVAAGVLIEPPALLRSSFLLAGRLSYAIYMLQAPILQFSLRYFEHSYLIGIATISLVLIVSFAADWLYDAPVRAALTKRLRRSFPAPV